MRNEIREAQKTVYITEKNTLKNSSSNFDTAFKTGLIGGVAMISYLLLIEALFTGDLLGVKFLKYFVFAIPMAIGISKLKERVKINIGFFKMVLPIVLLPQQRQLL